MRYTKDYFVTILAKSNTKLQLIDGSGVQHSEMKKTAVWEYFCGPVMNAIKRYQLLMNKATPLSAIANPVLSHEFPKTLCDFLCNLSVPEVYTGVYIIHACG